MLRYRDVDVLVIGVWECMSVYGWGCWDTRGCGRVGMCLGVGVLGHSVCAGVGVFGQRGVGVHRCVWVYVCLDIRVWMCMGVCVWTEGCGQWCRMDMN